MRPSFVFALASALLLSPPAAEAQASFASRPEVKAFVHRVAARHGFTERELLGLFSRVDRLEPVLDAMRAAPAQELSWEKYRAQFVNQRRIEAGISFWDANRQAFARAERQFGVPAEYILAILGVETFYGRNTGRWPVLDALATLAFDYPPRADFFRNELESYLLLARKARMDVREVRGSYAGAIGMPQFMPGSTLRYAVDFDGDGKVDLLGSAADAIGSVANFLRRHGWRPGEPVLMGAEVRGDAWRSYADGEARPSVPLAELERAGVRPEGAPAESLSAQPVALLELQSPERDSEYRIGFSNFYVLTRYNRSVLYACAVADLAAEVRRARQSQEEDAGGK